MADHPERRVQAEIDGFIKGIVEGLPPDEAAQAVALMLNRSAVELHRIARSMAGQLKGQPEWGRWAGLQNNARNLVLQSSTARDVSAQLTDRKR